MTSIYKTAYPYFSEKKKLSKEVIINDYRLTYEEILAIKKRMSDNEDSQLSYAVLLMVFKNLNYFPDMNIIPDGIIEYVKDQLRIPSAQFNVCHTSTITRHRKRIYKYYGVISWKHINKNEATYPAQEFVENTAMEASQTHNYPADIINVVVEQCKKRHFELPTFKQLDRIVKHTKSTVNQRLFDKVHASLSDEQILTLDSLLETTDDYQRSDYNALKKLPKNPTYSNFRELLKHHGILESNCTPIQQASLLAFALWQHYSQQHLSNIDAYISPVVSDPDERCDVVDCLRSLAKLCHGEATLESNYRNYGMAIPAILVQRNKSINGLRGGY